MSTSSFPPSSPLNSRTAQAGVTEPALRARSLPSQLRPLRSAFAFLFSFEALFTLFLFSNNISVLLPPLPIDETLLFFIASLVAATVIVSREGFWLPGLRVLSFGALFFGSLTISMLWTPNYVDSVRIIAYNLTFNFFSLTVGCLILARDVDRLRRWFVSIVLVGLVLALNGLWIWHTYGIFRFYGGFAKTRVYLAWGYPAAFAGALTLAAFLTPRTGTAVRLGTFVLTAILFCFLLVGTGRGPLLAFAASLALPMLVFAPTVVRGRLRIPPAQLLSLSLAVAVALYVLYLVLEGRLDNTLGRFFALFREFEHDGRLPFTRSSYWRESLLLWAKAPILGHGPGAFSIFYLGSADAGTHPHNVLLQIAVEQGLVGLLSFSMLLVAAIAGTTLASLRSQPEHLALWMLAIALWVSAMVSVDLASHWALFTIIGLLRFRPALSRASPPTELRGISDGTHTRGALRVKTDWPAAR